MSDIESRILVVAALIEKDQCYLVADRPPGTPLAGYWEFPGGKLHPKEEPRAGLQREIFEELGITIEVGDVIDVVQHSYLDKTVLLLFFTCQLVDGKPAGKEGQNLCWVTPEAMLEMDFLPADIPLIHKLIVRNKGSSDGRSPAKIPGNSIKV